MNEILALREKRAKTWIAAKAFLDTHRGEDGMVSAEDYVTYEKMAADVVALGKEIERLERQAAIDRELAKPKPCPFCGSEDVRLLKQGEPRWVVCFGCDARIPSIRIDINAAIAEMINKWNRRAYEEVNE